MSTIGKAHDYVENRSTFHEAMLKLDEKYGNVYAIMGLLVDEIKALSVVKKGDFKSIEDLSFKVNRFHGRLIEMDRRGDDENSYVLKEIESKINPEDLHKWLESQGDNVDTRMVGNDARQAKTFMKDNVQCYYKRRHIVL